VGFTEAPALEDLADLAAEAGVPLALDQGSGLLRPPSEALSSEATVGEGLRGGADLVAMSGDKLLGGPQAGLVAGRRVLVEAMRRNPLYRALRVDKMTLAALDAVLAEHEASARREQRARIAHARSHSRGDPARAAAFVQSLRDAGGSLSAEVLSGARRRRGCGSTIELPTASWP
jgi:L-seryl-tRNA(Ser) seleniumtransferase